MDKRSKLTTGFVTLVVSLMALAFWLWPNPLDLGLSFGEVTPLNDAWQTESGEVLTLPVDLALPSHRVHTISRVLPPSFSETRILLVRGSLQSVQVTLDDQVIYRVWYEDENTLHASAWHMIEVPSNSAGRTINLTFYSPYEAMSGRLNEISYGLSSSIHGHIFAMYAHRLMIGFIILFLGLFIVMLTFFSPLIRAKGYGHIGFFLAAISFWILGESRMLQYVTSSPVIIGSVSYLSLALIPIPMALYINHHVLRKPFLIFYVLFFLYIVNFFFVVLMQAFGVADFFETVLMTLSFIVIGMVIAFGVIFYERYVMKITANHDFTHALSIIFVFTLLEFGVFLLGDFTVTSRFLLLGVIILSIFVSINLIEYLVERVRSGYEKDMYARLAYTDMLTGGKTRLAFQENLAAHLEQRAEIPLRLVYFDFNDLKTINDTFGHLVGDQALIHGFNCMKSSFGRYGEMYRLGGDEFACLIAENIPSFETLLNEFNQALKIENKTTAYKISVAIGYTDYQPEHDLTPEHLMKRADALMYANKALKKQA